VKRILLTIIILLLLLQIVAAFLLGTERGSRWLIHQALPWIPGETRIGHLSGSILSGIIISDLHYQSPLLRAQLQRGEVSLNRSALWQGWIELETLYLHQLHIVRATPPADTPAFALPESLRLPFGIAIRDGRLTDLQITQGDQPTLRLQHLQLEDAGMRWRLNIGRLFLQDGANQLTLHDSDMALVQPYSLKSHLLWHSDMTLPFDWLGQAPLHGEADLGGSLTTLVVRHRLLSPQRVDSNIELHPFSAQRDFSSQHRAELLTLTLPDRRTVTLKQTSLQLDFQQGMVSTDASSEVQVSDLPPVSIQLKTTGDWQHAETIRLSARSDSTRMSLIGAARWQPQMTFNFLMDVSRFDPRLLDPRLHGQLQLSGNLHGERHGQDWRISADDTILRGQLNDHPLLARVQASRNADRLALNAQLDYGDNHIRLDGRANHQYDLRSQLTLNQPEAFHPDLSGALSADIHLRGERHNPLLDMQLDSALLQFRQFALRDIHLAAEKLGPSSTDIRLNARSGALLQNNLLLLNTASLNLQGSADQHRFVWALTRPDISLQGALRGTLDKQLIWSGEIDSLNLALGELPEWQLQQAAHARISRSAQSLGNLCLSDGNGDACVQIDNVDNLLSSTLAIRALPLQPFSALLGAGLQLDGSMHHQLDVQRPANGIWHASLTSFLDHASLTFADDPVDYRLHFEQAELSVTLSNQRLEARTTVALKDHGSLLGSLSSDLGSPDAALQVDAELSLTELRWLELLLPGIRQRTGRLDGKLSVRGQRQQPLFSGVLSLRDGEIDIADAGLTLKDIRADLTGAGTNLMLTAQASSGPGELQADGSLDLSGGFPGQLLMQIRGERFQALNIAEANILINPSLTLQGRERVLRLRGDVEIPQARLVPQQLPEMAIRVSEDQVIVNVAPKRAAALQLDADVMLRIGNNVRFNGFGLDARLGGNLQLIQKPEQPPVLNGDLRIVEGRYRAYGQNLAIDQGLLIFQERIDNPGLNIRAVRRIPSAQVVAGVAITGTLQNPDARLTSEPPMEESEIMAWLLTGRGLSGSSESDNAMIAQALAVYGLERGSGVTSRIGETLGLDEIRLGSDWENTDASLMLGKQISDRLYLRYAIGLFDALSTVMLRYTVSRKVHLEAQSGSDRQSIDLIYQIER
jgi:translocation and assembly module TamB